MSNMMMTDTFAYEADDSFYPDTRRFHASDRQLFSTPIQRHKTAKSIPCFTEDVGALELDNWMKRHPKQWSNEDVLDLIYFVASRQSGVTVPDLCGERFQDVRGIDLYSMQKKEFVDREPRYGDLLYGCIQELLSKCDFTPPEDLIPPSVETVEKFTETEDSETEQKTSDVERTTAAAAAVCYGQLPKPVEDLMMDDDCTSFEDAAAPVIPVRPAAATTRTGRGRASGTGRRRKVPDVDADDKNNDAEGPDDDCRRFVRIYEHEYDIDSAADFRNVLLPSGMVVDAEQDDGRCVYTDLSAARPGHHCYSVVRDASLPIDLRTTTAPPGLPLRAPLPAVLHHGAPWIQPGAGHFQGFQAGGAGGPGTAPLPHFSSAGRPNQTGGATAPKKSSKKSTTDEQKSKTKSGKGDGSGMGRHLWEFIRDLLRSVDSGDQSVETIIRWENRSEGIFRIIDSKQVATLWGQRKRNVTMTYEKLSRALRWSRTFGFLSGVPKDGRYPKKLCFRFGPLANWKD